MGDGEIWRVGSTTGETTVRGVVSMLAILCVAAVVLVACGDPSPAPPLETEIITPERTATSEPSPAAAHMPTPEPTPTATSTPEPTAVPAASQRSPDRTALAAFYESAGGDNWTSTDN